MKDSNPFFLKPRTVYWENLFFGKDSPLKPKFRNPLPPLYSQQTLCDLFFNLEVQVTDNNSGRVRAVEAAKTTANPLVYFQIGALLAYCYFFGIYDLHADNVIKVESGLQPIDVEIVFGEMMLPHESLLLPFSGVALAGCGFGHWISNLPMTEIELCHICEGYVFCLDVIQQNIKEIESLILAEKIDDKPIRIIFRRTSEYVKHINDELQISNLTDQEKIQLERGDIPYFFIDRGTQGLFYYSDATGNRQFAAVPKDQERVYARMGRQLQSFFDPERIPEKLIPNGLLYMAKAIGPEAICLKLLGGRKLTKQRKEITVKNNGKEYVAHLR